jgi:hypothetical protein
MGFKTSWFLPPQNILCKYLYDKERLMIYKKLTKFVNICVILTLIIL